MYEFVSQYTVFRENPSLARVKPVKPKFNPPGWAKPVKPGLNSNPAVYIYVCVCVCVCFYIYMCVFIYICVCVFIYICVCVCVCVCSVLTRPYLESAFPSHHLDGFYPFIFCISCWVWNVWYIWLYFSMPVYISIYTNLGVCVSKWRAVVVKLLARWTEKY